MAENHRSTWSYHYRLYPGLIENPKKISSIMSRSQNVALILTDDFTLRSLPKCLIWCIFTILSPWLILFNPMIASPSKCLMRFATSWTSFVLKRFYNCDMSDRVRLMCEALFILLLNVHRQEGVGTMVLSPKNKRTLLNMLELAVSIVNRTCKCGQRSQINHSSTLIGYGFPFPGTLIDLNSI